MYAWKMGLKTGQYYLRSRPARDAIQFTLDVDNVDVKEDGNYNTKNLSKAEMDAAKRLRKKRPQPESEKQVNPIAQASAQDLNKRRKITDQSSIQVDKKTEEKAPTESKDAKPWEGKEEEEDDQDYRWNLCEGCT